MGLYIDIGLKSPTENSFFLSMGGVVLVWMLGFFWRFGGGICTHSDGQPVALYGSGLTFDCWSCWYHYRYDLGSSGSSYNIVCLHNIYHVDTSNIVCLHTKYTL